MLITILSHFFNFIQVSFIIEISCIILYVADYIHKNKAKLIFLIKNDKFYCRMLDEYRKIKIK